MCKWKLLRPPTCPGRNVLVPRSESVVGEPFSCSCGRPWGATLKPRHRRILPIPSSAGRWLFALRARCGPQPLPY
eukprot:11927537-Alexandrium_andersonii.AAC.2